MDSKPKIDLSEVSTDQLYMATHAVTLCLGAVETPNISAEEREAFQTVAETIERIYPDVNEMVKTDD